MAAGDTNKDTELLDDAREAFKLAAESEQDNRLAAKDDLEFAVEEIQWPDDIKQQRDIDGRPCLTSNLLKPFIQQVVNDARQNRPSIAVHPADDGADYYTAQVFAGLIRNIENISSADIGYDMAVEFAVSSGLGYLRVGTDYACDDTFDTDLLIQSVQNPFSIYGDPHTASVDGSDWNTAFEVEHLTKKQFKREFKDADEVDWDELGYGEGRLDSEWCMGSGEGRRIQVANWWRREKVMTPVLMLSDGRVVRQSVLEKDPEGVLKGATVMATRKVPSYAVTVTKLSGAEVLEQPKPWAGRYIPIVPVYGHVINIAGKRRIASLIRSAKDAQRRYNYHLTTSTELTALAPKAPFIGPKGAFKTDREKWETANTETHPYIEYDIVPGMGSPPQRQGFAGVPAGEVAAAQQAYGDMKAIIGMFDASLGQRSNETSGRAIIARQREGDTATFHFIDNLSRAIRQVGRILIDLIPQVYTEDRVIRVLGPDGTSRTVKLGNPEPLSDEHGNVMRDADGQPLSKIYDLTAGKYDLVVSSGPSFTTKREEAAMQMTELIRAYPQAAPLIGDLLAKNLDWPGADEIAKRLKAMLPEQAKGGDSPEVVQLKQSSQAQANELTALKRTIEVMQGDREIKREELKLEARKLDIMAEDSETRRMQALVGKDGVGLTRDDVMATVLSTIEHLLNSPDLLPGSGETGQAAPQMAVPPVEPPMAPEPDGDEAQGMEPPGPEEPPQV